MNLHFILFYLIKLVFAVNLLDNKSQQKLVRKCSINEDCNSNQIKTVNLLDTLKRAKESNQDQLNNQLKNKKTKLTANEIRIESNRFNGKTLIEQVDILNKEVLNRSIRFRKSNENDQLGNKFKDQHDRQHSDKHNEQHHQLTSKTNEYQLNNELTSNEDRNSDKEKFNKISEKVFKSLQSLFEIELPNNPTFNEKFIDLIQALIVELNHIKSKLKQANCKMRLSFKSQRIDSDCETNEQEPCNCPKQTETEQQDLSVYNYQTISNQQIAKANNLQYNQIPSFNLLNQNATIKKKANQTSLDKTKLDYQINDAKNLTKTDSHFETTNSYTKATNATSALEPNANTTTTVSYNSTNIVQPKLNIQNSVKSKSKKETELSKQLRSAIDCFLCEHQWTKCLNVGFKCP